MDRSFFWLERQLEAQKLATLAFERNEFDDLR